MFKIYNIKKNHHTNQGKSTLACFFVHLDSGEGNREMQEMEVPDVQVPERGNLHFLFKTKHNAGNAMKQRIKQMNKTRLLSISCLFCCFLLRFK